jgi:hypothetical protein
VSDVDLGEWPVHNGLAIDRPEYSKGKYDAIQREAEHAGRGIWIGSYVEPWLYRVCVRAGGSPANCSYDANAHPGALETMQSRPPFSLLDHHQPSGYHRPLRRDE